MGTDRKRERGELEEAARKKRGGAKERSGLNRERIVDAALEVLDQEGIDGVSLRKLAKLLGVKAPAIYWHFKNKSMLVDFMAEAILRAELEELQPRQPDEAWQDWLMDVCKRLRKAMKAHRDGARVVAGAHPFPAVTLLKILELGLESLTSAGMDLRCADLINATAIHFTFGRVIEEQASPSLEEIEQLDLVRLFEAHPLFAQSVQQTVEDAKAGYDEFEDSLRLIIGHAEKG